MHLTYKAGNFSCQKYAMSARCTCLQYSQTSICKDNDQNSFFEVPKLISRQDFLMRLLFWNKVQFPWHLLKMRLTLFSFIMLHCYFFINNLFISNQPVERNLLSNFYGWIIFTSQQCKILDIPKMFSECLAVFY